jgi:hypothetical protein
VITASAASSTINSTVFQLPPRPGKATLADAAASSRYTANGACQRLAVATSSRRWTLSVVHKTAAIAINTSDHSVRSVSEPIGDSHRNGSRASASE